MLLLMGYPIYYYQVILLMQQERTYQVYCHAFYADKLPNKLFSIITVTGWRSQNSQIANISMLFATQMSV